MTIVGCSHIEGEHESVAKRAQEIERHAIGIIRAGVRLFAATQQDRDTAQSKGFAFVEMTRDGDADKAIHDLDGSMMDEREIKVNEAKPMRPHGDKSGANRRNRY